eukprot:scaffold20818_cov97-Skeletonema_marinoi.AAC.1
MLQAKSRTQMKAYNTSWQLKSTEEHALVLTRTPKLYVAPMYVGGGRYWGHLRCAQLACGVVVRM